LADADPCALAPWGIDSTKASMTSSEAMLLRKAPHENESILPIASVISFSTGSICEPPSSYSELLCTGTCPPSPSTANWFVTAKPNLPKGRHTDLLSKVFICKMNISFIKRALIASFCEACQALCL
jgi:hypothetical protein